MNQKKKFTKLFKGFQIKYSKIDEENFITEWRTDLDPGILVKSLLESIKDICKENYIDYKNFINEYLNGDV